LWAAVFHLSACCGKSLNPENITERGVATTLALLLQTRTSYGSASPNPYGVAVL